MSAGTETETVVDPEVDTDTPIETETAREPGWEKFVGPAVAFAIGLLMTRHAWGPRAPSGDDVMAIIVRAEEGSRVLRSFRLDGWSPRFITGFPVFLHYGPGLAIMFTIVRWLSLGFLSSTGAIQVLMAVAFAAVAPAAWFLARSLGMNNRAATGAGILALAVNSPFGVGVAGLYGIGLLPHGLAAPFVLVGLGAVVRAWTWSNQRRWVRAAAACFAVVIVTHVISTVIAGIFAVVIGLIVLTQRSEWRQRVDLARVAVVVGAGAAGLAAFWLLPYARHFDERGVVPAWGTPTLPARIDDIIAGRLAFGHYVVLFVVAGWAWALIAWRRERVLAFAAPVAAAVFMIGAHWFHAANPTTELAQQLANRGLGYACVLAIIPLGGLIDEIASSFVRDRRSSLIAGVLAAVVVVLIVPGRPRLTEVPKQQAPATLPAQAVAAELRKIVPKGARFATERDFPGEITTFGMSHADFWLAQQSGRNTVNTFNLELSQSGGAGSTAENLRDDQGSITAERFRRFGVTHVVTVEPKAYARLLDTGDFREVFKSGPLAILRVLAPRDTPDASSLLALDGEGRGTAKLERVTASGGNLKISARVDASTRATVAVGWSSSWEVRVDGRRVKANKSPDGLVALTIPQGRHEISLRFHRDYAGVFGLLIGGVTALALFNPAFFGRLHGRWPRKRPEMAS